MSYIQYPAAEISELITSIVGEENLSYLVWDLVTTPVPTVDETVEQRRAADVPKYRDNALHDGVAKTNSKALNFAIPNAKLCIKNNPQLLMWIYSAPGNFPRREAIRKTWGQVNLFTPMKVVIVFSLAVTKDSNVQKMIITEQTQYGDLVQDASFIDAYENLTYKVGIVCWAGIGGHLRP